MIHFSSFEHRFWTSWLHQLFPILQCNVTRDLSQVIGYRVSRLKPFGIGATSVATFFHSKKESLDKDVMLSDVTVITGRLATSYATFKRISLFPDCFTQRDFKNDFNWYLLNCSNSSFDGTLELDWFWDMVGWFWLEIKQSSRVAAIPQQCPRFWKGTSLMQPQQRCTRKCAVAAVLLSSIKLDICTPYLLFAICKTVCTVIPRNIRRVGQLCGPPAAFHKDPPPPPLLGGSGWDGMRPLKKARIFTRDTDQTDLSPKAAPAIDLRFSDAATEFWACQEWISASAFAGNIYN